MNQCFSKDDIDEKLGVFSFFQRDSFQMLIAKVDYLTGVTVFDENNIDGGPIVFEKRPKGLLIKSLMKSKMQMGIIDEYINYYIIEHKDNIIGKKDKSVIGRAVIGGVLFGPLGAIVGGISGVGEKDVKNKMIPDNILTIAFNDENIEKYICFSVSMNNYKATEKYFLRYYKDKLRVNM